MADGNENGGPGFDALLKQMPRIAEAVKAFPEAVQPQAFEMLMAEARGEASPPPRTPSAKKTKRPARRPASGGTQGVGKATARARRPAARKPSWMRNYDLTPKGKKSLKAFVEEKQPKTNHDRNVISAYYLKEVLDEAAVTVDHIFTCYKDQGWREPGDVANSLSLTSHRKGFIDTSNLDNIELTARGRNHVEQDLPAKAKKAK